MEKRFLVYWQTNGNIFPHIRYGEATISVDGKPLGRNLSEVELLDHTLTLKQAVALYPYGQDIMRRQHGTPDPQA